MIYRILADAVMAAHFAFVLFVVFGGLLALRWRWTAILHIPALIWGALIEFMGWPCPLTPVEKRFRRLGGEAGYEGGFIDHYIGSVLYPGDLGREIQIGLGMALLAFNALVYWRVYVRWSRQRGRA